MYVKSAILITWFIPDFILQTYCNKDKLNHTNIYLF